MPVCRTWRVASALLFLVSVPLSHAGIESLGATFHASREIRRGGPEKERVDSDTGGALFLFLKNGGTSPLALDASDVLLDGRPADKWANFAFLRLWPDPLPPGETGTLTLKATGTPLAAGGMATVAIRPPEGPALRREVALETPQLRLGSLVPAPDWRSLWLFLRNDGAEHPLRLESVTLNGKAVATEPAGGPRIAPASVKPVRILLDEPAHPLQPLALRAAYRHPERGRMRVGAPIRLTEPRIPVGTWSGSFFSRDRYMTFALSRLGVDSVVGHNDRPAAREGYARFSQRLLSNRADRPWIRQNRGEPAIAAWYLADEPDIGGERPAALLRDNHFIWRNAPHTPSTLTVASQKTFQRYGLLVDHPAMDHYGQYAPLVYGGPLTAHSLKNPFRYSEMLKRNTEPLRTWAWVQGVAHTTWSRQPEPWSLPVQFWGHLMAGAKGLLWFKGVPESYPQYRERYERMSAEVRRFENVRDLALYSDPQATVATGDPDLVGRMLVGPRRVLVPVANMSGTYNPVLGAAMRGIRGASVRFTLPEWMPTGEVREVTADGTRPAEGARVRGNTVVLEDLEKTGDSGRSFDAVRHLQTNRRNDLRRTRGRQFHEPFRQFGRGNRRRRPYHRYRAFAIRRKSRRNADHR